MTKISTGSQTMTPAHRADIKANPIRHQNEAALIRAMRKEGPLCVETHRPRQPSKPRAEVDADIIAVLDQHGRMTAPAVSEHMGKSRNFAHVNLARMAEEGKLVRTAINTGKARIYMYGVRP
jgi:hypothetical protein